jgi:hypothetical protein
MGQSCVAGLCGTVPVNDTRAGAITIPLTAPTTINTVDTTGASNHTTGPMGCSCSSGRDVFYTFTLTQEEIVYADTHDGQTWDSSLFLQNEMGANLTTASADSVTCNDDSCATTRSQLAARLAAGRYFLVLSGCSQGRATLRFQHLPVGSGTVTRVSSTATGTQTVMGTVAAGTSRIDGGCGSGGPENMFFFTTCPLFPSTRMHLTTCGTANWDTVLHQHSPARAPVSVCNDDFCGLQSSLDATIPPGAGLHAWYLDTFSGRAPGAYSLRYRFGDCSTDFATCTGVCRFTAGDDNNCGACARACTGGQTCTAGACACAMGQTFCGTGAAARCVTTATDSTNCGMCGRVCPSGSSCSAGTCAFTTSTRDVTVTGTQTINTFAASANITTGTNRVALTNVTGTFPAVGDLVLLHQTQRASGAIGYYEYRRVASVVMTTPAALVLDSNVGNTYVTSEAPFARAQIVRVEEVRNLSVPAGATLTAPAWNGNTGGILALNAAAAVTVAGTISMDGRGFRGRSHACVYRCSRGFQGEGITGIGGANIVANGNGGGGGGAGQDDASGGGGGYGAAGAPGGNGTCGLCREACPIPGGSGGTLVGSADLAAAVFLGGAGGEGGADEDGGNPGAGGNGGGIVIIRANTINNTGTIASRGNPGARGNSSACGGVGCGMGGGGAGAGGAVRLQAIASVAVGTNLVQVGSNMGGLATCGTTRGGVGSVGRIGVNAPSIVGTTTPSFDRN